MFIIAAMARRDLEADQGNQSNTTFDYGESIFWLKDSLGCSLFIEFIDCLFQWFMDLFIDSCASLRC